MSDVISFDAHRSERKSYYLALADRMGRYSEVFARIDKLLFEIEPSGSSGETIAADCRAVAEYLRETWDVVR